ncbi:MAG: efflux transporter periplasmic adaptor subunit, partial [Acidobacteria bacterium 37-71-11]
MFKNKWFWIVAAVVVVVGGIAWWRMHEAKVKGAWQFETVRIDRGKIVAKVTASGSLSALVTVQVGSQVSGRIAALYADFNSKVKKGELIAKIDPQLFQASVAQARANYVAA